jgi:hypothetical protein
MNLSENRRRWLRGRTILNTIHVSAGIFTIATVFQIAETFIDGSSTVELQVISAIRAITITTLMFLISGLINPDFMDVVFRMLGFQENDKTDSEDSGKKKEDEKNEKNDFLQLVKDYPNAISQKDLKILLKQRITNTSKFLTTSVTVCVSMIIGFLGILYALPEVLKQFSVQFPNSWFSGVAIIMGIIFFTLTAHIIRFAVKLENREMRIMRQYFAAITELNRRNQK